MGFLSALDEGNKVTLTRGQAEAIQYQQYAVSRALRNAVIVAALSIAGNIAQFFF